MAFNGKNIPKDLGERVRAARNLFVLTGAGVSAESGVPTFRGGGGAAIWKNMPFDVISSVEMIERDLQVVWEWFLYRLNLLKEIRPNSGHETLALWQKRLARFTLATQNIDGLHTEAGSQEVLELHGNVRQARCLICETKEELKRLDVSSLPPKCLACGGDMRPDVVLFGELLPMDTFSRASEAAHSCDVCFVVGTSALVYPAASLPLAAREAGAYMVEINPELTPLSELCDVTIQGRAGEVLSQIKF